MTELEKVIKGLECCLVGRLCSQCPYDNVCDSLDGIGNTALELLKEQQPRVMTLDEVRERKPFHLWVEDLETGAQVFPVAYVGGLYVIAERQ